MGEMTNSARICGYVTVTPCVGINPVRRDVGNRYAPSRPAVRARRVYSRAGGDGDGDQSR